MIFLRHFYCNRANLHNSIFREKIKNNFIQLTNNIPQCDSEYISMFQDYIYYFLKIIFYVSGFNKKNFLRQISINAKHSLKDYLLLENEEKVAKKIKLKRIKSLNCNFSISHMRWVEIYKINIKKEKKFAISIFKCIFIYLEDKKMFSYFEVSTHKEI